MTWEQDIQMRYDTAYSNYKKHLFNEEEWTAFCEVFLEEIMEHNKKVLENLKN